MVVTSFGRLSSAWLDEFRCIHYGFIFWRTYLPTPDLYLFLSEPSESWSWVVGDSGRLRIQGYGGEHLINVLFGNRRPVYMTHRPKDHPLMILIL